MIYFGSGANNDTSQRNITHKGNFTWVLRTRSSSFAPLGEKPGCFLT